MFYKIRCVENEEQLKVVLEFCYSILGNYLKNVDNYKYEDWKKRLENDNELLLFACENEKVVSAVLGRRESGEAANVFFASFLHCKKEVGVKRSFSSARGRSHLK